MTKKLTQVAPPKVLPQPGDDHYQLFKDVREAISSLPIYFHTETRYLRHHGNQAPHAKHRARRDD